MHLQRTAVRLWGDRISTVGRSHLDCGEIASRCRRWPRMLDSVCSPRRRVDDGTRVGHRLHPRNDGYLHLLHLHLSAAHRHQKCGARVDERLLQLGGAAVFVGAPAPRREGTHVSRQRQHAHALRVQGAAQWWRMLLERAQKLSRRLARTAVRLDLDHEEDHLSVGRRIPIMMKNTGQMVGGVKSLENNLSNRCGSLRARAAVALEGRFELE